MSLVIGFVAKDAVVICADSGSYDAEDNGVEIRRDPKCFERGGMIFGAIGNFRIGQLLRYSLSIPRRLRAQDPFEYLATAFIESVRKCLREGGATRTLDQDFERSDQVLIGYEGRLFRIDSDFAIAEVATAFDAIGGGATAALGALWGQELVLANARRLKRDMAYDAHERVLDAMSVAERTTSVVRKPFVTVRLPKAATKTSTTRR